MFTTFTRILRFAFQNFARNFSLSFATVTIVVFTLFSISVVFLANYLASSAIQSVEQRADLTIYMKKTATAAEVTALTKELTASPQVLKVTGVSPEEALVKFQERRKDDASALRALEELGQNPLGTTLVVQLKNPSQSQDVLTILSLPTFAKTVDSTEDVVRQQGIIDRLAVVANRIRVVGISISMVFVLVAILVIYNTIKMAIYTYRDEIAIMKLVGASNWFVRGPFVVESILYGLVGTAIALGILFYPLLGIISPFLERFFEGYASDILPYFHQNFFRVLALQLAVAITLSVVSSALAIRKYLKV